ncbi:putative O-glycosylation ligase, exosortase A system-associated [Denitromonas halophila]|uniref:Putative O-glycosylation ligase, exosortase A system-associated n=1 Tax=Denitromonas halophila TaxID=1629404 RepID=A0A557QD87_9RHOO|nr:putative O-glycosylation ligase, exosortase A system-associated [Denitromonas halophila]TVO50867.1 putative O-glycosylation ligase, exosortase A system-associated [Denitromonas halophila]
MRDLIVTVLFIVGAVVALKRPYYGALLWVWIGLMNPHRLGWGFAYSLPFAMASVVIIALGMLFSTRSIRWQSGAPVVVLVLMILWMTLTSFTAMLPEPSQAKLIDVLKVLGMTLVVGALVANREQIIGLIWVVAGSIAFFGVKGGIFTLTTGGEFRVWGPPSSLVEGNNELALALIISIPFLYFLAKQATVAREFVLVRFLPEKWLRRGLMVSILLCAVAVIGSHSRGALLAIVAMAAMMWWRSRSKVSMGFLLLALTPAILLLMPEEWFSRMGTIETYQEDLSALGRINAWHMAINIANDRIFGAGFATASPVVFNAYAPNPDWVFVAHSIYFQVLGDHGYIGLGLYLLFWILTYRVAGRLAAMEGRGARFEWVAMLGNMTKVSLVGFAVGGAFLSLAYWDMPFYLMIILLATERYAKEVLVKAPEDVVPSAEVGNGETPSHQRSSIVATG